MIKKLAIGLVCLIVLLAAGGYFLMSNLDGIIKNAVEKYASAAVQADVRLDGVKLTLASGEGMLSGLSVGNPKGFSTPKAFYLGSINIKLDTNSIKGAGPIVIRDITIDQPQVTYELLNSGTSNLQAIQNNTQAYANSFKKTGGNAETETASADKADAKSGSGRKIIISNLIIRNGQIAISQELLKGRQLSAPLPEIHLTNIGKESGGANAAQVAQQIFGAISSAAAQASVTELAKEKISGLINVVPTTAIGGAAVDAVGNKLKSVFGP
jgi:hypothetical protein